MTVASRFGRRAWLAVLLLAATLVVAVSGAALAGPDTPAGVWRTYDDHTGKPRGVVRIEQHDYVFAGRVVSTIDPAEAAHGCDDCSGDRQHQPIIGLEIMRDMRADGDHWGGGTILDPQTGKVYHCTMALEDGGRRLVVRGYIGISLFGRSQSWVRISP